MGLSSQFKMTDLARLARSNDPAHRGELLLALGALCALSPLEDTATEAAVGEIMLVLYPRANESIRFSLCGKLCQTAWAMHSLILAMARDIPKIAAPVIFSSPVLRDDDLIDLADKMGAEHRVLIAGRPHIGELVTATLVRQDEPSVLVALVENVSARLGMESFATCVRMSRRVEPLRAKLTLRQDMPRSLIPSLFAYSDEATRQLIAERFQIDAGCLSSVVKDAIDASKQKPSQDPDEKIEKGARLLVEKMARSERLTPSFIIKALNERKFALFDHALARLAGVGIQQLRKGLQNDSLYALALSCRAARIDRSVFPAIHSAMQAAGRKIPPLAGEAGNKAAAAFGNHSPAAAAVALRLMSREP